MIHTLLPSYKNRAGRLPDQTHRRRLLSLHQASAAVARKWSVWLVVRHMYARSTQLSNGIYRWHIHADTASRRRSSSCVLAGWLSLGSAPAAQLSNMQKRRNQKGRGTDFALLWNSPMPDKGKSHPAHCPAIEFCIIDIICYKHPIRYHTVDLAHQHQVCGGTHDSPS